VRSIGLTFWNLAQINNKNSDHFINWSQLIGPQCPSVVYFPVHFIYKYDTVKRSSMNRYRNIVSCSEFVKTYLMIKFTQAFGPMKSKEQILYFGLLSVQNFTRRNYELKIFMTALYTNEAIDAPTDDRSDKHNMCNDVSELFARAHLTY
jgi:hypothetical protein